MELAKKKIGIWGFGIVGKSALAYFNTKNIAATVMEAKELSQEEHALIKKLQGKLIHQDMCEKFLNEHDLLLASPGIDLRKFEKYSHKFITELDLFFQEKKSSIIAITGTIGKTTITTLLAKCLARYQSTVVGGNIGTAMLDLLHYEAKKTVLEVSSFQLEHCKIFAPDLAIWTNFYPNHLDRHTTMEEYFEAKYAILKYQNKNQQALVPLELANDIAHKSTHDIPYQGAMHYFSSKKPCNHAFDILGEKSMLFWIENDDILCYSKSGSKKIAHLQTFPQYTFATNWLIITAALTILTLPIESCQKIEQTGIEHRLEKVGTYHGIDIYNDSKATIMESTIAAVNTLQGRPIIVFLGGLSKGVDRSNAIASLASKVNYIVSFGKEAESLQKLAQHYNIPCTAHHSLDEAFHHTVKIVKPNDQILFSPGGSSYDLFKNYEERGLYFKSLVKEHYLEKK